MTKKTAYDPRAAMRKISVGEYPTTDTAAINDAANNFAIKWSLLDFANKTSLVGPPFIIGSTNWITRSVWIMLFVAGIGMTVYNVVENTLKYTKWPVQTELTLDYAQLTFPMVTVCNVNPVRLSGKKYLSSELQEFLDTLNQNNLKRNATVTVPPGRRKRFVDNTQYHQKTNKTFMPSKYKNYESDTLGGSEDTTNYIQDTFKYLYGSLNASSQRMAGHDLDDMLLSCSFETRQCNSSDFTLVSSNTYGNCYIFNKAGQYKARRRGQKYGLSLMLYLELDEYIMGLTSGYGARITITDHKQLPFPHTDGVYLSAGAETDVGLRMVNISRLGSPHGTCYNDEEYLEKYGVKYTRKFCQSTCKHRYIISQCNCYQQSNIRYYPKNIQARMSHCQTDAEIECMTDILKKKLKNELVCNCASPCTEKTYDTQISSCMWPTPDYLDGLIDKVCRTDLSKKDVKNCNRLIASNEFHKIRNFLKVNIFYRDLNFQVVAEKEEYPWYTFLSDLGGSIGLYLGLSVLGLFEIIHLLLLIVHHAYWKLRKAGQTRPTQRSLSNCSNHLQTTANL